MKRIKKYINESSKFVFAFIFGAIVFSVVGVKAAYILAASEVVYDNSSSGISSTNVQGAIDELYAKADEKAKSKLCKKGYYTISDGLSNYTCTKLEDNQNVITLKLNGSGEQSFLYSSFNDLPSYVYVDGIAITPATSYTFNSEGEHTVVMVWDSPVTNMSKMFYNCSNLTSLDLSNFDTSRVTRMSGMFYGIPNGIIIKSNTSTCNKIASDSEITASYTCTQ